MGMGIVSEKDFLNEKKSLVKPSPNEPKIPPKRGERPLKIQTPEQPIKGRGEGNVGVPNTLRNVIGEESVINGRQSALELAKTFGISPSSVSAYDNGSTSTSTYAQQPNLDKLNEARAHVSKRARVKLLAAMNSITGEKLEQSKAIELASVAKAMSGVMKDMEPESPKNTQIGGGSGPTFVFYSPTIRVEDDYNILHVKE